MEPDRGPARPPATTEREAGRDINGLGKLRHGSKAKRAEQRTRHQQRKGREGRARGRREEREGRARLGRRERERHQERKRSR